MTLDLPPPKLVLRACYEQLQACRRWLKARPKTRVEKLAERVAAASPQDVERMAKASWPGLQEDAGSSYIRGQDGGAAEGGVLALIVMEEALTFVATGIVAAGKDRTRRILLINGAQDKEAAKGRLDMALTGPSFVTIAEGSVALGSAHALAFRQPEGRGLYPLRFIATLTSGRRLAANGLLAVVDGGAA